MSKFTKERWDAEMRAWNQMVMGVQPPVIKELEVLFIRLWTKTGGTDFDDGELNALACSLRIADWAQGKPVNGMPSSWRPPRQLRLSVNMGCDVHAEKFDIALPQAEELATVLGQAGSADEQLARLVAAGVDVGAIEKWMAEKIAQRRAGGRK